MTEISPAMRTALAKALWVAQQDYPEWAARTVDDVFSPADDWPEEALKVAEQVDALLPVLSRLDDLHLGWADWFEHNSSHVGGQQMFNAYEVAELLRGQHPFGSATGDRSAR